jgi:hypothetical protein
MPTRRLWQGLRVVLALVATLGGCSSRDIALKPPKHHEEIVVPPVEEAKFSKPPQYPAEVLNQDAMAKTGPNGVNGMPNMSAMNGMGAMGAMNGRGGMGGMGGISPGMGMGR